MKTCSQFMMIMAIAQMVNFPQTSYAFHLKANRHVASKVKVDSKIEADNGKVEKRIKGFQQRMNRLGKLKTLGAMYDMLESGIHPKYREFLLGKIDYNHNWREQKRLEIETDGNKLKMFLDNEKNVYVQVEFFQQGDVAMKINGVAIQRTELSSPAAIWQKIERASAVTLGTLGASSSFSLVSQLLNDFFFPKAHAMQGLGLILIMAMVAAVFYMLGENGVLGDWTKSSADTY